MKQICIFYFIAIILIVGCTDNDEILYDTTISNKFQIETSVSLQNMETLVNAFSQKGKTRATKTDVSYKIQPYVDSENDTLMYVVQCDTGGWTVYAADKRVPAILAQSENGDYSQFMEIEAIKKWTDDMAAEMKIIKHCSDEELNIPILEQKTNIDFWNSFCNPTLFVKEKTSTRVVIPDFPIGHYELYSTTIEPDYDNYIYHLTRVDWHQNSPYNTYCPYVSNTNNHAVVGCTAVAAAQVLYYLHYHLGVPEKAPSNAFVSGNCDNYSMSQSNYSCTIWDYMQTDPITAAPFLANIAQRLGTHFGETLSWAYPTDWPNRVFSPLNLSCSLETYDSNIAIDQILDSIPILLAADDYYYGGHAFVIDGYRKYRMSVTNVYEWVYDSHPSGVLLPFVPPMTQVYYEGPVISEIQMNWGFGASYNNVWFAPTSAWVVNIGSISLNYNLNKRMICNYSIINN